MTETESLSVNINEASEDELVAVSGIGNSLAQRIINQRPYESLHDLVNVSGINERKLASLMPCLAIESRTEKTPPAKTKIEEEALPPEKSSTLGETEAFLFLEDQNDLENAFLIVFGGFILGLIILLLRRRSNKEL